MHPLECEHFQVCELAQKAVHVSGRVEHESTQRKMSRVLERLETRPARSGREVFPSNPLHLKALDAGEMHCEMREGII